MAERPTADPDCPYAAYPHPPHNLSQGWSCPGNPLPEERR